MTRDQLEFSITRYLDGDLTGEERVILEQRLKSDPHARALLDEHQRLDALLKSVSVPELPLEALSRRLSLAIADAPMPIAPEHSLRMPWVGSHRRVAVAASVLIAAALSISLLSHGFRRSTPIQQKLEVASDNSGALSVTGPAAEIATGPQVMEISVGPSKAIAGEPVLSRYSGDVVTRSAHIMVASGANPVQDSNSPSFDMQ